MTNLQKKRLEKKISQSELAKKCKIPLKTLQHYEQEKDPAKIENANMNTILTLAFALDCNPSDIVDDETMIDFLSAYEL